MRDARIRVYGKSSARGLDNRRERGKKFLGLERENHVSCKI